MFNMTVTDYDREVYEKEIKDFLPKEFIDFHIHSYKNTFKLTGDYNGGSTWTSLIAVVSISPKTRLLPSFSEVAAEILMKQTIM